MLIPCILSMTAMLAFGSTPAVTIPVTFEANAGQTDPVVKYLARDGRTTVWLTEEGAVFGAAGKRSTAYWKLRFDGGSRAAAIEGEAATGGVSNYFVGRDPARWRSNIRQFAKVRYREVWPGIDVVFYGNPDQLEYDFIVHPGADPAKIRLSFDGARRVIQQADGDLSIRLNGGGEVRAHAPVMRQGAKRIGGRYRLRGKQARFAVDAFDHSAELVIDPILTYATLLGGSVGDQATAVAIDKQGNLFVTGETSSPDFPLKNALFSSIAGSLNQSWHVFLAKINPSASGGASLIFNTLYGSDGVDAGTAIALDASGNPVVAGASNSTMFDLPQVNVFANPPAAKSTDCGTAGTQTQCASAFVAKFNAAGSALLFSSYLTGSDEDGASAVTVDASGNTWVAGYTSSLDFPVQGQSLQRTLRGSEAGFVSEISAAGKLVYSTLYNGTAATFFNAIAVDGSGNVYAAGTTTSATLATPGGYQPQYPGIQAGLVVELSPINGLLYSTYLGASDAGTYISAVGVDASGNIYVGGVTASKNFPVTAAAYQAKFNSTYGSTEAFLTKLNPGALGQAQLVYSTYFGGSGDNSISALAIDPAGHVTVAGSSDSVDFPTTSNAFQCCWFGVVEGSYVTYYGFVARFDPTQSGSASLTYSSLLGGTFYTTLGAVALDSTGNIAAVAGWLEGNDIPVTPSAIQSTFAGQVQSGYDQTLGDAYLARFDFSQSGPVITTFLNGAGLDALPNATIAPGLIFALKGTGLGPSMASPAQLDPNTGLIATKVQGVQVFVNGVACALTYVSATQINAVAPYELAKTNDGVATIQAYYNGVPGSVLLEPITPTAPGILSLDDGSGQGVILNQDGSLNGPNNPAATGSIITIYATGEGQTNPAGIDGGIATNLNALPHPVAPLSVTVGNVTVNTFGYAGTAPEEIYGLLQINMTVPSGVTPGSAVPVVLTVGNISSQKGLTMAIH